jgi:hypothetical protein
MRVLIPIFLSFGPLLQAGPRLPAESLVLDLDAAAGVSLEAENRVEAWENQAPIEGARAFVKRDKGRKVAGSGRPELRERVPELGGRPALVFRRRELVCMDEDTFDGLTTGSGHTWLAVIAVHENQSGLEDVNPFFGNLRNGGHYEGLWAGFKDDRTLWYGVRNGRSFGRFDENNPQILGPRLAVGRFHLVGGRMASGAGEVELELLVDDAEPVARGTVPVAADADPSRMVVGQERDAVEHPGYEAFDGEIARLLIWERPLADAELRAAMKNLKKVYGLE